MKKKTAQRLGLMFLTVAVVSPVMIFEAMFFVSGSLIYSHFDRPGNLFFRVSDFICDRIYKPWFGLFGLWEDVDSCS